MDVIAPATKIHLYTLVMTSFVQSWLSMGPLIQLFKKDPLMINATRFWLDIYSHKRQLYFSQH